jgi:hypothetical protein
MLADDLLGCTAETDSVRPWWAVLFCAPWTRPFPRIYTSDHHCRNRDWRSGVPAIIILTATAHNRLPGFRLAYIFGLHLPCVIALPSDC